MELAEHMRSTASEIVRIARGRGMELEPLLNDFIFCSDGRMIFFWIKRVDSPGSGAVDEAEGTIRYNMQGRISVLPSIFKDSASAFHGVWSETGALGNLERGFELARSWLIDRVEIDALPLRCVRRCQI